VLESHMSSNVHTGLEKVKRQLDINTAGVLPRRYSCLYACGKSWARKRDCVDHMEASTEAIDGPEHDALKAADGWYEVGFRGTGSIRYHMELEVYRKRIYMHHGLEFEPLHQLQSSIPHPTDPEVMLGDFPPYNTPTHLQDEIVELGPDQLVDTRPEWRAAVQPEIDAGQIIEYDSISDVPTMPIPPRLRWHVTETEETPTLIKKSKTNMTDTTDKAPRQNSRRVSWAPLE
jgi:hypothetical protein